MPARESLLDAAGAALARRPWSRVRMVDVAAGAGFSRQTLYNEFGSKEGLARALLRRETDGYLRGVDRALAQEREPAERLAAVAAWTVGAARANALVRAALTGCWSERLPVPSRVAGSTSSVPRSAGRTPERPRRRSCSGWCGTGRWPRSAAGAGAGTRSWPWPARAPSASPCRTSSRPARDDDDPAELVRGAIGRWVAGR